MVKRKKKPVRIVPLGFGAKDLTGELIRAEKHLAREEFSSALNILLPLSEQYPEAQRVWELLNYASLEVNDFALYQKVSEGWAKVQPNNANVAYSLASAYLANAHPLMALQAFRKALALDPEHQFADDARKTVEGLEKIADSLLSEIGLDNEEGWEIAILHEQGQAYLEEGEYAAAREAENEVLKRRPQFLSARNNLSLINWLDGKVEDAIATAQTVLEADPDNVHALSNLVHFHALLGDEAAARPYAQRLISSQARASDGWTKKVEGLSYLRDDAAVVAVFDQAQATGALQEEEQFTAMFFHLVAVALARLGRRDEAITQWQKSLELHGSYPLAEENLTDIRHTVGLRHGAWPFFWQQWLLPGVAEDLLQTINASLQTKKVEKKLDKNLQKYLDSYPDFLRKVSILLERGGPSAQELIINLAEQLRTPELLAAIKDFALSQNGTDKLRNRAATLASQEKLLPKKVNLWIEGEQREILLMGYEFHGEPLHNHSRKVTELLGESLFLLRQREKEAAKAAEALLRQALELEPDSPNLLNNLGSALEIQGREAEMREIMEDVIKRFPDYLFCRMAKAKELTQEGDLEAAEALILPVLERERFHFLEFGAFADAYIGLLVAKKQFDGARTWFDLWKRVNPKDSRLVYWETQFENRIWIPNR